MQPKLDYYIQLATQTELDAASSPEKWRSYLALASRLYKYDHPDQILIYAQRPNATACAEYEVWNRAMNRYIKRGSSGIALLTDSGNGLKIRYVFDAADTGAGRDAKMPNPWKLEQWHHDFVQKQLSTMYQVSGDDLSQVISAVAQKKTDAYWDVNRDDIMKALQNDCIEMEEHQIEAQYKAALHESVRYSVSLRCGLLPEIQVPDIEIISRFQTVHVVSQLGAAVSRINYSTLRQISQCIQKAERAAQKERMINYGKDQRSTEDLLQRAERTALQAGGGLLYPGSEIEGYGHDPNRQVWQSPQEIPEGAEAWNLFSNAADRGTVSPSERGGQGGQRTTGADDAAASERSRSNGRIESQGSAEMGGTDERLQGTGRGNHHEGTGLRLIQPDSDDQISLFPSEGKQIEYINEKAESGQPSAFSFAQEDIEHVLRLGGNTVHHRELIVDAYQKQKNLSEIAKYLKTIYKGGNGFVGSSGKISAWYAEDGIYLSYGSAARYNQSAKVIPWEQAAERIDVLLQRGQFATTVELAEAESYVRTKTAEKLLYLYQDLSGDSKNAGYLSSIAELRGNGFPEDTTRLSNQLKNADFRRKLQDEFEKFQAAYQENKDMLRFRYRDLHQIGNALAELDLPRLEFDGGMVVPHYAEQFITEDEVDAVFSHGSGVAGGENRINQFFQETHSLAEKAEFLKKEYGTGGRSHALSGSDYSWEDYDSRGIRFTKMECQTVSFTWENAAKRIDKLIRQGRYLNHDKKNEIVTPQDAPAPVLESAVKTSHPDFDTAQESEKFIDHFYVIEDLSVRGPLELTEYGTLPEALGAYFALPSSQMKALGAQNTRSPLPGSLDFLQCISGRDKVIKDYLKVDGWDCCVGIIEQIEEAIADYVRREDPLEPGYSPWGEVDSCSYLQSGVFEVSTPSHGGVMIDCQCEEEILSPAARNVGFIWGGYHCYEEDADAPVAIRELLDKGIYTPPVNDYWKAGEYEKCIDCSIQNWHPDYWNDREARVTATNTYKGSAVEETNRHVEAGNFQITDENLGAGTPKAKFESNLSAIRLLKELEEEKRQAIPAEQEILSQYVGWGGLPDAFDPSKENWHKEYEDLKETLTPAEYEAARASTLNAHYTSPTIIRAMYDAVGQMGFDGGNILEPSCGVGNFFGMLPPEMQSSHLYGVELDSITGRIAKQLYPKAEITVAGFETTDRRDFFDLAIGNVPFGQYQVNDKAYNKLGFNIHNYFFGATRS